MQVTITEPVFLWYFGITATLLVLILLLVVIALVFWVRLMKLVSEKALEVSETVDVVQDTVRNTAESFDDARERIVQFFNFSATANGVANMVRSIRNAWHEKQSPRPDGDVGDAFADVDIKRGSATKE